MTRTARRGKQIEEHERHWREKGDRLQATPALSGEKILKEVKIRKGEEVRNREEISKMGARKQELEVEEIISWAVSGSWGK